MELGFSARYGRRELFPRKHCCRATTAVIPVLTINLIILIFMTVCAIVSWFGG